MRILLLCALFTLQSCASGVELYRQGCMDGLSEALNKLDAIYICDYKVKEKFPKPDRRLL